MKLATLQSVLAFLGRLALGHAKATVGQAIASLEDSNSPLLQYPTQFMQGIVPKQIHSHNDCEYAFARVYALNLPLAAGSGRVLG